MCGTYILSVRVYNLNYCDCVIICFFFYILNCLLHFFNVEKKDRQKDKKEQQKNNNNNHNVNNSRNNCGIDRSYSYGFGFSLLLLLLVSFALFIETAEQNHHIRIDRVSIKIDFFFASFLSPSLSLLKSIYIRMHDI